MTSPATSKTALTPTALPNHLHRGSSQIALSVDEAYATALNAGFALLDQPIDDRRLKQALASHQCGAFASFEGWVRNHNNTKPVSRLTYYGYEQLANTLGARLATQAKSQFEIEHIVAIHRIGALAIGDTAVWIGAVSAHRYPAFEACRWLLDAIKADIPVWKQEFYADGAEALWLSNCG